MKYLANTAAAFLPLLLWAPLSALAQQPPLPPQSGVGEVLSPEERQTLMDASRKARQDPTVIAAKAARETAMKNARDAMVAEDKSLAPLIARIAAAPSPGPGVPPLMLTADERSQLLAARAAIQGTPAGVALEAANANYRDALKNAMIAANPAVALILAKLPQMNASHTFAAPQSHLAPLPAASPAGSP